jgi:hypothetical protein
MFIEYNVYRVKFKIKSEIRRAGAVTERYQIKKTNNTAQLSIWPKCLALSPQLHPRQPSPPHRRGHLRPPVPTSVLHLRHRRGPLNAVRFQPPPARPPATGFRPPSAGGGLCSPPTWPPPHPASASGVRCPPPQWACRTGLRKNSFRFLLLILNGAALRSEEACRRD